MRPELFTVGPFTANSFGLMAALGLLLAGVFVARDLRERGMDPDLAVWLLVGAGVGGIVGARVYFLIENGTGDGIFSGSGLTWYGGLIGGALGVIAVAMWRRHPLGLIANVAAPAIALGQAVGRIGCQLAGDGDYGSPTSLPWGMSYPQGTVPTTEIVHPTPLYEAFALFAIFFALWRLRRVLRGPWGLLGAYLLLSGTMRFLVEFVRVNPEALGPLTAAQLISLAAVVLGSALIWWSTRRPAPAISR